MHDAMLLRFRMPANQPMPPDTDNKPAQRHAVDDVKRQVIRLRCTPAQARSLLAKELADRPLALKSWAQTNRHKTSTIARSSGTSNLT